MNNLQTLPDVLYFFQYFRFSDLVDILFVTLLVYRLLVVVQGTRALQILLGLLFAASLWVAARIYELQTLSWMFKVFFENIFIIIIVLFQDQIKSALSAAGATRIWGRNPKTRLDRDLEEVVSAVVSLGKEKCGALIVFEMNNGLMNYASTGTLMESGLHSDLLYTLFQKNSPLHDGAVIIAQGRLQAAGCFLPLSKNTDLDKHFGTRHRAALGVTEVSDAVVVVVSEETGAINVAQKGKFTSCSGEIELRKELKKWLLSRQSRAGIAAQLFGES